MKDTQEVIKEVTKKIQQCLNEIGFKAEIDLSEHDGIVHTIKELNGKNIKVITHVTDCEAKSFSSGAVSNELSGLCTTVIRPTLEQQTSTKTITMDS